MDVVKCKIVKEFTVFSAGCWRHYVPGDALDMERADAAPYVARGLMLIEGDPAPAVKIVNRKAGTSKRAVK